MDFPFKLPLLLDGGTGTNLIAAGMPAGVCVEQWILDNPETLLTLQQGFIDAGSKALYAPTFGANRVKLASYGLEDRTAEINKGLVELTKSVAKPAGVLVGGDLSPTGLFVEPYGDASFDDLIDIYTEQVRALEEAGVDFIGVETQMSLSDMRAAVLAVRKTDLPVFVTITVDENGRSLMGSSLLPALITMQAMGVDAVGLNCSMGPKGMAPLIKKAFPHAQVPLIVKPNAGLPHEDDPTKYDLSPDEFAEEMGKLIDAGASIIGGCCGTTPEHIAALNRVLKEHTLKERPAEPDCYAAAIESEAFFLGDDLIMSEPLACSYDLSEDLIDLDDEQVNTALVLVNTVNDAKLLAENSAMTRLPIAVRAHSLPVLEAALRYFQGRLIVDSNCPIDRELIEPVAQKYGAIVY